ncbi:MAG TPA: hypothetical protein VHB30_14810, partial [Solirubrobacteraceae bacterium]|nr:hypothetical protein [Solirubrobacteraceae bacterium]
MGRLTARLPAVDPGAALTVALGAVLTWIAIHANGGLRVGSLTAVEMVVDVLAGVAAVVAVLAVPALRGNGPGTAAAALFALLVLSALVSTAWSIDPSTSWQEANRLTAYLAVFAIGMALVRLAPRRLPVMLGGITLAAVAVSAYALAHKAFPGQLQPDERWARLEQPFGYWNAVGLMAALGVPGCLWLGARRVGHAALNALAYPAIAMLLVVVMFAYSRGSLLALAVGCGFWFAVTPLRLRGAVVLLTSAVGAAAVTLWAFSQDALTTDGVALSLRDGAGHELAVAVLAMLLAELLAGLALGFAFARRPPSAAARRRAGIALLVGL